MFDIRPKNIDGYHEARLGWIMTEFGHFTLLAAFVLSSCAVMADLVGKWRGSGEFILSGRYATVASFACLSAAVTVLLIVLVRCDFSVAYVARHSAPELSAWSKISALWAEVSGSLLLWLWMQAGFVAIVFARRREDVKPFYANARVAANLVCVFFLLALILKTNPFAASEAGAPDGGGLDPRLQHPLAALHPPILLTGYAACAVPFAWSFGWLKWNAARGPAPLLNQVRNWILLAWLFLTLGLLLGVWSAYEHLGWEGNWLRNIAQNFSLLPWLSASALLYFSRVCRRNSASEKWIVALSLVTFTLCISAVFLTRSGPALGLRAFGEPALARLFIILLIHIWVLAAISLRRRGGRQVRTQVQRSDNAHEVRDES